MARGKFIVFEGIDGSGKSTQARLLFDYLLSTGQPAVLESEPSNGVIGSLIQRILREEKQLCHDNESRNDCLQYLFASDRFDHLYKKPNGIVERLNWGANVVCDRYYFSSIAYGNENMIVSMQANRYFPNPDIVFYMSLPVSLAMQRIVDRNKQQICYETMQNLSNASKQYIECFRHYPGTVYHIDASLSISTVHGIITGCI